MTRSRQNRTRVAIVATCVAAVVLVGTGARTYSALTGLGNITLSSYTIGIGSAVGGTVTLRTAAPATEVVALQSSNPQAVSVPSGVLIAPRSDRGTFVAFGRAPGCVKIVATHSGDVRTTWAVVQPVPTTTSYTMTVPGQVLGIGWNAPSSVKSSSLFGTSRVYLTSSTPAVATVPASVDMARGVASFTISTRSIGCALITGRIGTQTVSKIVQVIDIGS
jgi:hypothetical protein